MSRQDANAAFASTSFLYGGNAGYIDDLYARYEADPNVVDAEWQVFFGTLKDDPAAVLKNASGPSWALPNWPQLPRDDLTRALAADWGEVERAVGDKLKARAQTRGVEISAAEVQQATRDSIHALMLIRAYRIRGAFHANLDPLAYGFEEADFDRRIFLDRVLGLEFGTIREIVTILQRTYCQTLAVEFMHISDGAQ